MSLNRKNCSFSDFFSIDRFRASRYFASSRNLTSERYEINSHYGIYVSDLNGRSKAQENQRIFTAEEQAIVDLSNSKWEWMAEKNVEKLAELFHENSQFVHMGGYWGKQGRAEHHPHGWHLVQETEIHDVQVKFAAGTATVYSRIHLHSVVGGNAVHFPFIVTEVYVMENGRVAAIYACLYTDIRRIIKQKRI